MDFLRNVAGGYRILSNVHSELCNEKLTFDVQLIFVVGLYFFQ